MDVAIEELYMTASVLFHFLPLGKGQKRTRGSNESTDSPKKRKQRKKKKKDSKPDKVTPPKGEVRSRAPEGLRGYSGVNGSKQRACFDFNLAHGCSKWRTRSLSAGWDLTSASHVADFMRYMTALKADL